MKLALFFFTIGLAANDGKGHACRINFEYGIQVLILN
jgi:hypothetical protein